MHLAETRATVLFSTVLETIIGANANDVELCAEVRVERRGQRAGKKGCRCGDRSVAQAEMQILGAYGPPLPHRVFDAGARGPAGRRILRRPGKACLACTALETKRGSIG